MGVARVRLQRMQSHDKAFAAARAKVNHTITHLSRCSGSALLTPHEAVGGEIIVRRRVCTKSIKYITTPSRWQVPAEQARLQDMHAHVMRPEAGMPREHRVCLQHFLCTVPMLMGVLESYWYLRPVNWPSLNVGLQTGPKSPIQVTRVHIFLLPCIIILRSPWNKAVEANSGNRPSKKKEKSGSHELGSHELSLFYKRHRPGFNRVSGPGAHHDSGNGGGGRRQQCCGHGRCPSLVRHMLFGGQGM